MSVATLLTTAAITTSNSSVAKVATSDSNGSVSLIYYKYS